MNRKGLAVYSFPARWLFETLEPRRLFSAVLSAAGILVPDHIVVVIEEDRFCAAIGDLTEATDAEMDHQDADSMYSVLADEVIPRFYERDGNGIPRRWIAMMKRSIQTLVPQFSSDRMVAEYVERIY